jgi:hypothetical protein
MWGSQGSILGPFLFITCINDLPSRIKALSDPIIFTDDASVIISNKNFDDFYALANLVLSQSNK